MRDRRVLDVEARFGWWRNERARSSMKGERTSTREDGMGCMDWGSGEGQGLGWRFLKEKGPHINNIAFLPHFVIAFLGSSIIPRPHGVHPLNPPPPQHHRLPGAQRVCGGGGGRAREWTRGVWLVMNCYENERLKWRNRNKEYIVAGATRPCNSIFSENYLLYKLVAKKLNFVLSKLQISIWKDRATVAW